VLNSSFLADKALYSPRLALDPEAPVFDNVEQFTATMDGRRGRGRGRAKAAAAVPAPAPRNFTLSQRPITDKPRRGPSNVLSYMIKLSSDGTEGPMAALAKLARDGARVEVRTRGLDRIRGVCRGFLKAFDKHWNLALVDVDEEFIRRRRGRRQLDGEVREAPHWDEQSGRYTEIIGQSTVVVKQTKRHTLVCQRHISQLLIRGEHVVAVSKAQ